jgi:histone deacetylase 1/2
MPPTFWVEALHTANHLINIRPSRAINHATPHFQLFNQHPTYSHLRVFGCLCFPNLNATTHTNFSLALHAAFSSDIHGNTKVFGALIFPPVASLSPATSPSMNPFFHTQQPQHTPHRTSLPQPQKIQPESAPGSASPTLQDRPWDRPRQHPPRLPLRASPTPASPLPNHCPPTPMPPRTTSRAHLPPLPSRHVYLPEPFR